MSRHNIGHGSNEVVRKVLIEYDAELIPYESAFRILQQCTKSVYWCDGNEDSKKLLCKSSAYLMVLYLWISNQVKILNDQDISGSCKK